MFLRQTLDNKHGRSAYSDEVINSELELITDRVISRANIGADRLIDKDLLDLTRRKDHEVSRSDAIWRHDLA